MSNFFNMGRRDRRENSYRERDIRETLLEQPSTYFEEFSLDVKDLRIQWGLLSVRAIQEIDLSDDEVPAMLLSQLELRDTFIETLASKMYDIVSKGRSLEARIKHLLQKLQVNEVEEKCEVKIDFERYEKESGSSEYKTNYGRDKYDRDQSDDEVSSSHISKSEGKDDEEKDRIKALVAMAFEAHGYDFAEQSITNKNKDSSEESGKEEMKEKEDKKKEKEDKKKEKEKDSDTGWGAVDGKSLTEQVQDVASNVVEQSGYVFQPESGLYYDQTSGYYYNAENGLYYDSKTGTYFYYDHNTQSYQFHSQVPVEGSSAGENTDEQSHVVAAQKDPVIYGKPSTAKDVPPSIRLMVTESKTPKVKVGDLHVVTINGGKVGRGSDNLVLLLDENVSKEHAEFIYKSDGPEDYHYFIKDLGSAQGTFINDTCICIPGEPSDEIEIGHGWELQFGSVKLKCHIHPGYLSCNECEPGLVRANQQEPSETPKFIRNSAEKSRKKELDALKKKYALIPGGTPQLSTEYADRAKKRRKEKGSDNPYEKTEVASTQMEIKDTNKGFEMLKKMGWSKGEGLGKSQPGIINPIEAASTVGREGLGFYSGLPPPTAHDVERKKIQAITVERFKKL